MSDLKGVPHHCANCKKAKDGYPVPELCFHVKVTGIGYCRDWREIDGNKAIGDKQ